MLAKRQNSLARQRDQRTSGSRQHRPGRREACRRVGELGQTVAAVAAEFGVGLVTAMAAVREYGRPLVVEGRSGTALQDWVCGRDQDWRDRISVAALDPFRAYATALRTSLPQATRVLDAFHVVRLGLDAVDQVRRRIQQGSAAYRAVRLYEQLVRLCTPLRRTSHAPRAASIVWRPAGLVTGGGWSPARPGPQGNRTRG
jgi:transposase